MKSEVTRFGFDYGSARFERVCDDERTGKVVVALFGMKAPGKAKTAIEISVSKSGCIRVFSDAGEWKPVK